jgi:hypothetical protein
MSEPPAAEPSRLKRQPNVASEISSRAVPQRGFSVERQERRSMVRNRDELIERTFVDILTALDVLLAHKV